MYNKNGGQKTMKRTKRLEKREKSDLWELLGTHGHKPDESTLHDLLENKVSKNTYRKAKEQYTLGQRAADAIAHFAGSWTFIFVFIGVLLLWMVVNAVFLANDGFDPYPFILLNLVLSCVAAVQAPLIMMSQNRQEEKDRLRAENDYQVNIKSECILEDLHGKMDTLLKNQETILKNQEAIINWMEKHEESNVK